MAHIVLGSTPEEIEVVLTRNADFFCTLITEDGTDWPAGVDIRLILGATSFDAVIVGDEASFSIQESEVNDLIDARVAKAKLMYIEGTSDICWGVGVVNSNG